MTTRLAASNSVGASRNGPPSPGGPTGRAAPDAARGGERAAMRLGKTESWRPAIICTAGTSPPAKGIPDRRVLGWASHGMERRKCGRPRGSAEAKARTRDHLATWPSASVYQDRGHINVLTGESQFRHSLRLLTRLRATPIWRLDWRHRVVR
jgi:hypothetical protein